MKNENRGRVLDAGAGEGALTLKIMQMGFEVEASDFSPERFKIQSLKCRKADLNKVLPYPNDFFDFCVCVEVIEHLCNPHNLISEFNRILKRNGKLIITTPNIHSIWSRLRFLLYGEHSFFTYKEFSEKPIDIVQKLDKHINPVSFPELEYILSENNMKLEEVTTNRYVYEERSLKGVIAILAYPLIKTLMVRHWEEKRSCLMASDELICGEILILKAKKL